MPTVGVLTPPACCGSTSDTRGPGRDFSERERALLTLLRPHLHQAYLDAEQRRNATPQLTPRQLELLRMVAAGHTNAQIARRVGVSEGNRAHPPAEHLRQAASAESHGRGHARISGPRHRAAAGAITRPEVRQTLKSVITLLNF